MPLLALCLIVSISTPVILAFFIADVARGQPDRLPMRKKQNQKKWIIFILQFKHSTDEKCNIILQELRK